MGRYRVFLTKTYVVESGEWEPVEGIILRPGSLVSGADEPLAETDSLNDAHEIAIRCARDVQNATIVVDDEDQKLWWYDEKGEEQ